jgi:Group 4 capsule polysaccharide lipoprotein gfcB, YjbF
VTLSARWGLAAAALLALAGCGSADSGNTNYSQFYQLAKQSLSASFGNVRVTRDQAASIPYASMGFSLGDGNQILLVLATDSNGEQLWTGPSHAVIVTRDGRIIRTVGLGHDLAGLTMRNGAAPAPGTAVKGPFTSTRLEDFPELGIYGAQVSCRAHLVGQQKVNILGQPVTTNRVDEACQSGKPERSFVDTYWVDPDNGLVWRSRQHVHPKGGVIETELFRPPG